jgi:hypothetical protein
MPPLFAEAFFAIIFRSPPFRCHFFIIVAISCRCLFDSSPPPPLDAAILRDIYAAF